MIAKEFRGTLQDALKHTGGMIPSKKWGNRSKVRSWFGRYREVIFIPDRPKAKFGSIIIRVETSQPRKGK